MGTKHRTATSSRGAEPVELNTWRPSKFQSALASGSSWGSDVLRVQRLSRHRCIGRRSGRGYQTQAQLISTMLALKGFDGEGLWGHRS